MRRILIIIAIMFAYVQVTFALGTLSAVYLNPSVGNDANDGSSIHPVKTWDKALSLATHHATIFITGETVTILSNETINGNQYGATGITVTPNTGYTGALFTIAIGRTGTLSNITLKGVGSDQTILSVNAGGTLEIGSDVHITDMGQIAMDGGANPINLTATPPVGMNYRLSTVYATATDEARALVHAGSVVSPLMYFTLIEPHDGAGAAYEMGLDGATIRLYERPVGAIYFDPVDGNDTYSGAKSSRPVKTLAKATAIWNSRNTVAPGIVTNIYVLSSILISADMTLNGGITLTRFPGDANHSLAMKGNLFVYTDHKLTIDDATIHNGSIEGTAFYSGSNGTLTLNNGAVITSDNLYALIDSRLTATTIINHGSSITHTGTGSYCIRQDGSSSNNSNITINGGAIISSASHTIYNTYGSIVINGGAIINQTTLESGCVIDNTPYNTLTINGGTINGGVASAINSTSYNDITLEGGTISSNNTKNGAIYLSFYFDKFNIVRLNGQATAINGIINFATISLERNYIAITSPAVTQDYTIRIADNTHHTALVQSKPSVDLGPYLGRFTLETKTGYGLTAYANKRETDRNIVLHDPNGVYVNDYTGDDSYSGTSPNQPVKTLQHAASLTTSVRSTIYICDSTLTINSMQSMLQPTPRDTIRFFMFRSESALIAIKNGGALTLQNIAIHAPSMFISRRIQIDAGTLRLKTGVTIYTGNDYTNTSFKYGIYQTGGNVIMESGSKISGIPASNSNSYYAYGIYKNGTTSMLTIDDHVIIENQGYCGVYNLDGKATIGAAILQNNSNIQPSTYRYDAALYIGGDTVHLNGTILRNNLNRAVTVTGSDAVVIMNGGTIYDSSNTPDEGAVSISYGGTFNFISGNISAYSSTQNAIYLYSGGSSKTDAGHLIIGNQSVIDSGFIYSSSPYYAPISLRESLHPSIIFHINLGDNMAGSMLVDGTSSGTFPASVSNFKLNPNINTLLLQQSGNNIVVNSGAIYLDGSKGNDARDGSTAATAVKTFRRATEIMRNNPGSNLIVILGTVYINASTVAAGEITDWDLSFNPNAVVQRGLGFTGQLAYVTSGYHLTLSNITMDGNKENVSGSNVVAMIFCGGTLTVNDGAILQNNGNFGVNTQNGNFYMNGGEISGHVKNGVYFSAQSNSGSEVFIMTGGRISNNDETAVYALCPKQFRMLGGEISHNSANGCYIYNYNGGVVEIGGDAKIMNNRGYGMSYSGGTLDSLIISSGEFSNNKGTSTSILDYGIFQNARNVQITGGTFDNNNGIGLSLTSDSKYTDSNCLISNLTTTNNTTEGIKLSNFANISIKNSTVNNNNKVGINITNSASTPGVASITDTEVSANTGYGIQLTDNLSYSISGHTQIINNQNTGIYSNTNLSSSISGNVLIKGNRSATTGGGLNINKGKVKILDNVTFEADTCTTQGGAIYVSKDGAADISGNITIKDCITIAPTTTSNYGSAIYSEGEVTMRGGLITGCKTSYADGSIHSLGYSTVYAATPTATNSKQGHIYLSNVTIRDNAAGYGGAIYVGANSLVTLDVVTISKNTTRRSTNPSMPESGAIHLAGGANGGLLLRDEFKIDSAIYINSTKDTIYIDEPLSSAKIGEFHLLVNNSAAIPGTVLVSPNGTTVTDASQFLTRFTLMNTNGRGLDKGGKDEKHIMIVNQFFIDCTNLNAGNGASPSTPFNSLTQTEFTTALKTAYTTVWVSGPLFTGQAQTTLASITKNNVNLRRYTGFVVAAQPYPAYDSVMITVRPGHTLIVEGGNSSDNMLTISGEGGSSLTDASIFKNNGTLTLKGYTQLYFNPTGGPGGAVYQNGTFNLSGNVAFNVYSPSTVYLSEGKVIHIPSPLNATTYPIGITVETSPVNTHLSGRVVVTGSTTNVPSGMVNLFYNELPVNPLPLGRTDNGTDAHLMFYLADRNVTGVPIYLKLQDAFDASVSANNDEVRLYGHTEETIKIDKQLRYKSNGFVVAGSFTLDSVSKVQLLDDLLADTLYLRASTFSNKTQLNLNGHSARITKAAYFDLRLPDDAANGDWYPVNLPFDAQVPDIRDAADTSRQISHLQDFAIAEYSAQRRAFYGIGNQPTNPDNDWQFFNQPTMTNGVGYMVTTSGIQTLRFKAENLHLFATATAHLSDVSGPAGFSHRGINYVAQPLPVNAVIAGGIPEGTIVQVSESLSSDRIGAASYVAKTVNSDLVIAPYTNYYYQTDMPGTVQYTPSTNTATVRSGNLYPSTNTSPIPSDNLYPSTNTSPIPSDNLYPSTNTSPIPSDNLYPSTNTSSFRSDNTPPPETPAYYELRFYDENPSSTNYDALFVAASEYASKDRYEFGRDVVKMGAVGHAAQIWSKDFDVTLCANEVFAEDGTANIPLFIHTPIAGREYRLRLHNAVNEKAQLWLLKAGRPVQNLTKQPEYIITGTGHTTDEFSLQIRSNATANKPVETGAIYIYTEHNALTIIGMQPNDEYRIFDLSGRLYASGKAISNRTRIIAQTGAYVVHINGKNHKVIVQ